MLVSKEIRGSNVLRFVRKFNSDIVKWLFIGHHLLVVYSDPKSLYDSKSGGIIILAIDPRKTLPRQIEDFGSGKALLRLWI